MGRHYKDSGEKYLYEENLEKSGYKFHTSFAGNNLPEDFNCPIKTTGWNMRKSIKQWAEIHNITDFRIVRANGYWRDLYPSGIAYELWVKI